ncbi:GTPase HflX [candidate division WOR-3 bacterium]|nr:GTPase HflX [candidate division WOR-3 bacterium]
MSTRVLLVGVARSSRDRWLRSDSLDELAELTRTAGGEVVEKLIQVRARPEPGTLVGRGMVEQLARLCREYSIALVIFDESLSPTQQRNIEREVGVRTIDRPALILDIFALHARTAEARIQVELAQLEYRQSRLTGLRTELSRLGGGIGTRGPGETRLEVDRRRIQQRITALRRSLARVDRERTTQRRRRQGLFKAVLVGYTNAGKSTLFNRLTDAGVLVSERLFATLDPSTRVVRLERHAPVVFSDTVGFIRHLPHELVASFRATLAEVREADLLLHVVDATEPRIADRISVVEETLEQVGAANRPRLLVLSKSDRLYDDLQVERLRKQYPDAVLISGSTGAGLDDLLDRMRASLDRQMVSRTFTVPDSRPDLLALVRGAGRLISEQQLAGRRRLVVRGFRPALGRVRREFDEALRPG